MPKDAKKNVDRYKIRGGDLNEFEFRQNQGQVKEANPGKGAPITKTATATKVTATKATARKGTATKKAAKTVKGATARKLAARKAAKR